MVVRVGCGESECWNPRFVGGGVATGCRNPIRCVATPYIISYIVDVGYNRARVMRGILNSLKPFVPIFNIFLNI